MKYILKKVARKFTCGKTPHNRASARRRDAPSDVQSGFAEFALWPEPSNCAKIANSSPRNSMMDDKRESLGRTEIQACPFCRGTGKAAGLPDQPCANCDGTGRLPGEVLAPTERRPDDIPGSDPEKRD
jgi:hypothetical protein